MRSVTRADIEAAARRIGPHVRRTPVIELGPELAAVPVTLKLEQLQHTGSFKPRAALNRILANDVPRDGVVAASGGNFGLGVAYAARALGHTATIFVPGTSPREKIDGLRDLGAAVTVVDGYYAAALEESERFLETHDALVCHAYDQPEVVAGGGTLARELDEQAPLVDTVLVAVGGGGLIAGAASWLGDRARLVAVETETTPTMHRALEAGEPVDVDVGGLAASSLGARRIGAHAWEARRHIDEAVLVSDDDVRDARRRLWGTARIVAEPGGAAAVAALTAGAYRPGPDQRVAVIVCGANTDPGSVGSAPPG